MMNCNQQPEQIEQTAQTGQIVLQLKREELIRALQLIVNLSERKQQIPILTYLLVQVAGTRITLTASDLEMEISSFIESNDENLWSEQPLAFTMPGRKMLDICRLLTSNSLVKLTIDPTNSQLQVASLESRFTLPILPSEQFPLIKVTHPAFAVNGINLSSTQFRNLLLKTMFTIPLQDVRHYLTGLLLDFNTDQLQVIATDGHRLAAARTSLTTAVVQAKQLIVPRKTVVELSRILATNGGNSGSNNGDNGNSGDNNSDETPASQSSIPSGYDDNDELLTINYSAQYIQVTHSRFQLTSKLIEGHYPSWQRIIPKKGEIRIELPTEPLLRALQRVHLLVNEMFHSVILTFVDGWLKLDSNNPGQEARDRLPIAYHEAPLAIMLNIDYLRDILKVVTQDSLIIYLHRELGGIVLEEKNAPAGNLFVIMPIKKNTPVE